MQKINRDQLVEKIERRDDFELIDVLPEESYKDYHIPGAKNFPVNTKDFTQQVKQEIPDKEKEIVVYCKDTECSASPQAAQKLESIGYTHVYDYEAGKEDWKQAGLQVE